MARFYASIYTHTIPWALHTKTLAKTQRTDPNLLGNVIDRLVRNAQDGQTLGIPIGPDTSVVIAEILLAAVDELLSAELGPLEGFRVSDDFELAFASRAKAESALAALEDALGHFELALNSEKTAISELPLELEETWLTSLRRFEFRDPPRAQASDLIRFFSSAFTLAGAHPRSHVLSYAVGRLRDLVIDTSNQTLFLQLLTQCAVAELGTLPHVLSRLLPFHIYQRALDLDALGEVLNNHVATYAPVGTGNEVAWAIWGAMAFGVSLDALSVGAIGTMQDSVVALLALDARRRGLAAGLSTSAWEVHLDGDGLYGEQWLLVYESLVKRWLTSSAGDVIGADPDFAYLRGAKVRFYNTGAVVDTVPTLSSSVTGLPGYPF